MNDRPGERGAWITFEGIEGSGKSTQIERLAQALRDLGLQPVVTREPGGTSLGVRLRSVLLQPAGLPMEPLTELLLYTADRAQHLAEVVLPSLETGKPVLCDRYLDATLAYQGFGRGLGTERIRELHRHLPLNALPDRTLLLDIEVGVGLERARRRNDEMALDAAEGRFERERLEFHRRVRDGYLELAAADPERIRVVDAGGNTDDVESRVRSAVADLWPALGDAA